MNTIATTYLDVTAVSTTTISACGAVPCVYVLQPTSEYAILKGYIIWYFVFFKYCYHDDSLFIFWFTALSICFNIDLVWLELIFM